MKIDISTLSAKIAAFKQLSSQNAVSPQSLGALLDEIATLIGECAPENEVEGANLIYNAVRSPGSIVTALGSVAPPSGLAGQKSLELRYQVADIVSGEKSVKTLSFPAASISSAGLMTTSEYFDLTAAKSNIADLQDEMRGTRQDLEDLAKLGRFQYKEANFALIPEGRAGNSRLRVLGYADLIKKGYVPYVFRLIRKSNYINDKKHKDFGGHTIGKKGWCLYGSCHSARINKGYLEFRTANTNLLSTESNSFSAKPSAFARFQDSCSSIRWGKRAIDFIAGESFRTVHLHYALAFGPKFIPSKILITPANMASPLVPFDIVFSPSAGFNSSEKFREKLAEAESEGKGVEFLNMLLNFSKPTS